MERADDPPIRVGLVGYGLAGSVFHAPLIASNPEYVLDTIVTANSLRQDQARSEHPGARIAERAAELWERADDLDLVVIASPNRTHVALARAALERGLAVVVDKPVARTAAEALELAQLAEEGSVLLSVFQNRRWDADFLTLSQLLDKGELGSPWRFESRFERWRPEVRKGWRESGDPAEVGGLLYDLGSHLVDQALVLFGPVSSVYAEVLVRRPGAEVDDDSFMALTHENGVRSHLWTSGTAARPGPRFRVLGSRAGFVKFGLDLQEAALREGKRPGPGWGSEPEESWGRVGAGDPLQGGVSRAVPSVPGDYPAYYRGVAQALRAGGPPPVSAREAAAALTVIEAAARSAREGRVVPVAP